MKYYQKIKQNLINAIQNTVDNRRLFVKNPDTDFIRNKKLPFFDCLSFILSIGGNSINSELIQYSFSKNITISDAAFIQQRRKIKPDAFKNILHNFVASVKSFKKLKNYRLIAADGCMVQIPYNPSEKETYMFNGADKKGWNKLHLNAFYDILNHIFVSINVEPGTKQSEAASAITMAQAFNDKSIIIADRNYCTYNVLQAFQENDQKYLIRSKAPSSDNGILGRLNLETKLSDDETITIHIKRGKCSCDKQGFYKSISSGKVFSNLKSGDTYSFTFRVIKFPLSTGETEYLITNLSPEEFSYEEITYLYNLRWKIETAFRDLKYSLGLLHFHSKKAEYTMQEVYAKIIMYNYCSLITHKTKIPKNKNQNKKQEYKINFKDAIQICINYFKSTDNLPDIEEMLLGYIYKVKPNRSFKRNKTRRDTIFFHYRIS